MKTKFFSIILVFGLIFTNFSCQNNNEKKEEKDWKKINENLIKVNKYLVKEDRERIESYIDRKNWNMAETETGYWYEIYESGTGKKAEEGMIATVNYKISLLDGTLCYTSDSLGPKIFKIGQGNVVSGLQQGIQLLKEGDKARFIFPPFLAHGILGDDDKIPPRSIVIYDVELVSLSD